MSNYGNKSRLSLDSKKQELIQKLDATRCETYKLDSLMNELVSLKTKIDGNQTSKEQIDGLTISIQKLEEEIEAQKSDMEDRFNNLENDVYELIESYIKTNTPRIQDDVMKQFESKIKYIDNCMTNFSKLEQSLKTLASNKDNIDLLNSINEKIESMDAKLKQIDEKEHINIIQPNSKLSTLKLNKLNSKQ